MTILLGCGKNKSKDASVRIKASELQKISKVYDGVNKQFISLSGMCPGDLFNPEKRNCQDDGNIIFLL